MTSLENPVPGGIYIQNIEQRLKSLILQLAKDTSRPWKVLSIGMAPAADVMPIWASGHLAGITYQQLLDSGLFAEPPVVFLCGDQSAILFYILKEKVDGTELRPQVERILFEGAKARLWQEFELPRQTQDFLKTCQRYLRDDVKTVLAEPSAAKLDTFPLSTPAFVHAVQNGRKRGRLRILIVEDDPVTGKLLLQLLKDYDVKLAVSAQQAVENYAVFLPDLVLLDVGLPQISGLEFLEVLRSHDPKATVVMLTADSKKETLEKAVGGGAVGFIAKPFTFQKIRFYIEKIESR